MLTIFTESERELPKSIREGGGDGRVMRWRWVNFQCRGVLLIRIIVGQWSIALAMLAPSCFSQTERLTSLRYEETGTAAWRR